MKLRIDGNSIRLRLGQSEVADFARCGRVEARVDFGGVALVYSLESSADATSAGASFDGGTLEVVVPVAVARHWAESTEVGISAKQEGLSILVEKDFKCIHKDANANADAYPNPLL